MLHKDLLHTDFWLPGVEKHFHDHAETWVVPAGRGTAWTVGHDGQQDELRLEAGDAWMTPAGTEPWSGPDAADFRLVVFPGIIPDGCHVEGSHPSY